MLFKSVGDDGERDQEQLEHVTQASAARRPAALPAGHRAGDRDAAHIECQ
jgi:hypothetical protein